MIKALFLFNKKNTNEEVILKFGIWSRYFFPKYFTSQDAPFHKEMDLYNLQAYRGELTSFVNVAFRGASKTARTKLFIAFCVANDEDQHRRYIRILSDDIDNAKQSVLDIYNMFVYCKGMYSEIFAKTKIKREETMGEFTTTTGIKLLAKPVGVSQRGKIMEDAKSDFDYYDDFESKTTLRSAVITNKIADNMEEARTGLAIGGSSIYACNYISEAGNVHRLIQKKSSRKKVLIIPVVKNPIFIKEFNEKGEAVEKLKGGNIQWSRYSKKDIEEMKKDDDDFEGERMCNPAAGQNVYFDRPMLDKQIAIEPKEIIAGFKIFKGYNPSHRIAGGHDVAGGLKLDSSTSVFVDFDTVPNQVVATYANNEIEPEAFGDEVYSQGNRFGGCLLGIENNRYERCIMKAKVLGANLYETQGKEIKKDVQRPSTYGWNTNAITKDIMMSNLREAIRSGTIDLNDPALIAECKSYTKNDILDRVADPRLTTRHFDLLIALAIALMMREYARVKKVEVLPEEITPTYNDIGL